MTAHPRRIGPAPKPAMTDEQRTQIREAAKRIAARAPEHFNSEQRDLIERTYIRAYRREAAKDRREIA